VKEGGKGDKWVNLAKKYRETIEQKEQVFRYLKFSLLHTNIFALFAFFNI
jgi:hypothetical protein